MNVEIPILVEPDADPEGGGTLFGVRPLFFEQPASADRTLANAIASLAAKLEKKLDVLGRSGQHRQLADWTFSPEVDLHWLDLRLDLRGATFHGNFPVVTFRQLDRLLAFSPRLDEVWFEVPQPKHLAERAGEVYTRWFRQALKQRDEHAVAELLDRFAKKKKPWITLLDLSVTTRKADDKAAASGFALLDDFEVVSGSEELEAVGRCQDLLYPDGLSRAVCREAQVDELERLLQAADRRPLLLVGPSMVGKTALVHEFIHRRAERRAAEHGTPQSRREENVWLLAPQRLISGMSYVGQWENRLLAILKEAQKQRHILYFDDLLGLYQAGVTCQSALSVADVLKPYVERRDVRVLAETTPEQLRVFRERDRGFADMFQIIDVNEPDEREVLRILVSVVRMLESRHGVRFGLDALPAVLELCRCWQPDAAFPGKAARWLNRLAVKHQAADVSRNTVLDEFRAASGLQVAFADTRARLPREGIVESLHGRIIGQEAAVEAMADVVSVAKARLNDRQRPLGTLFFLGPTGVGKTECAKALAEYLFGDAARLVRFDMNEFVSPQSVARLVGTFQQPEGLLTAAVRRQPFCVLLLDEIEKAHPDVFDLLLQILGEARLTDALGRTASFANVAIILTSNLGTRQSGREIGFAPTGLAADDVYRKAVEEFFRPEFLNRLDRIVPFRRLDRRQLREIARTILADVAAREGLRRRKCAIELAGDALGWIVERGYHTALGARAMRRAVEDELVRPMARQLAAISCDTPTVMSVRPGKDALGVHVVPLAEASRRPELARPTSIADPRECLVRVRAVLARLQAACESHRPAMYEPDGRVSPRYHWYLAMAEYLQQTRALAAAIADELDSSRRGQRTPSIAPKQARDRASVCRRYVSLDRRLLKEFYSAHDVVEYFRELADDARRHEPNEQEDRIRLLLDRLALADMLSPGEAGWPSERAMMLVRSLGEDNTARYSLIGHLYSKYCGIRCAWQPSVAESEMVMGLEFAYLTHTERKAGDRRFGNELPDSDAAAARDRYHVDVVSVEGYRAERLLQYEAGTHLFVRLDGRLEPVQVVVAPLAENETVGEALQMLLTRHEQASRAESGEEAAADPFVWRPTVSLYGPDKWATDLQSGARVVWERDDLTWDCGLAACAALPPEFLDLLDVAGSR
jgi:ATP-dependent Clp protease ATP-binding subunit ClpC